MSDADRICAAYDLEDWQIELIKGVLVNSGRLVDEPKVVMPDGILGRELRALAELVQRRAAEKGAPITTQQARRQVMDAFAKMEEELP